MSRRLVLKRIGISMLAGLLLGALISEVSFRLLDNGQTRPPKLVQLDIPAGTSSRLAQGQADPTVPTSMTFVVGDELMVNNHDSVSHQLGPLFIPAGSSASMRLASEQGYSLLCSFEPSKYLQLEVLPPLTLTTRILGVLEVGLNVGFLIAVYSVFAMPKPKKDAA